MIEEITQLQLSALQTSLVGPSVHDTSDARGKYQQAMIEEGLCTDEAVMQTAMSITVNNRAVFWGDLVLLTDGSIGDFSTLWSMARRSLVFQFGKRWKEANSSGNAK